MKQEKKKEDGKDVMKGLQCYFRPFNGLINKSHPLYTKIVSFMFGQVNHISPSVKLGVRCHLLL